MADAMVALANQTLSGEAASVTFGSIPATYKDLVLVLNTTNNTYTNIGLRMRLNGDTGANYSWVVMRGTGSAAQSQAYTGQTYTTVGWTSNSIPSPSRISIFDYASTSKFKSALSRGDEVDGYVNAWANLWSSNSAVTSITLFNEAGNFSAASTFTLYGIVA